jgi:2-dehydro-3-deoxyphosphogluconate aldolase/(4S)-4-hydroxy-2-oxoglutarate aldolase
MCHRYDVAAIPGAFTPTEVLTAWEAGADLVKLFPGLGFGPTYVRDLRGPLPQARLMVTGGITWQNAFSFLEAGAVAVGIGDGLVDDDTVARGDYAQITELARRITNSIGAARIDERSRVVEKGPFPDAGRPGTQAS